MSRPLGTLAPRPHPLAEPPQASQDAGKVADEVKMAARDLPPTDRYLHTAIAEPLRQHSSSRSKRYRGSCTRGRVACPPRRGTSLVRIGGRGRRPGACCGPRRQTGGRGRPTEPGAERRRSEPWSRRDPTAKSAPVATASARRLSSSIGAARRRPRTGAARPGRRASLSAPPRLCPSSGCAGSRAVRPVGRDGPEHAWQPVVTPVVYHDYLIAGWVAAREVRPDCSQVGRGAARPHCRRVERATTRHFRQTRRILFIRAYPACRRFGSPPSRWPAATLASPPPRAYSGGVCPTNVKKCEGGNHEFQEWCGLGGRCGGDPGTCFLGSRRGGNGRTPTTVAGGRPAAGRTGEKLVPWT